MEGDILGPRGVVAAAVAGGARGVVTTAAATGLDGSPPLRTESTPRRRPARADLRPLPDRRPDFGARWGTGFLPHSPPAWSAPGRRGLGGVGGFGGNIGFGDEHGVVLAFVTHRMGDPG